MRWSPLVALIAALHLSAGAVLAADSLAALTRLVAADGFAVTGGEDGLIFAQQLTADCRTLLQEAPAVIAGPAGGRLTLRAEGTSCPGTAPPPAARCGWSITPAPSADESCRDHEAPVPMRGEASWTGWEEDFELTLPEAIGAYELTLDCALGTSTPTRAEARLYVTLGEPRPQVSPPRADWYERGTCWAAGLRRADGEAAVLRALLPGIYAYGGAKWRYGSFPDGSTDTAGSCGEDPSASICSSGWCHCCWQSLALDDPPCNYGSCYEFSEVLDGVAATLGLGGLIPVAVYGEAGKGFATRPGARSLDPHFPANMVCDKDVPGDLCPPYLFSSHSLRLRDGIYYDSTFDSTYDQEDAAVYLDLGKRHPVAHRLYSFYESPEVACLLRAGYGDWNYFSYPGVVAELDDEPEALCPVDPDKPVTFDGRIELTEIDNSEGQPAALVAAFGVAASEPGRYTVYGLLLQEGEVVAARPRRDRETFSSAVVVADEALSQTARIEFSGEAIAQAASGRFEVRASLYSDKGFCDSISKEVEVSHKEFGETLAKLGEIRPSGKTWPQEIQVLIDEPSQRPMFIDGRLALEGETLAYFGGRLTPTLSAKQASFTLPPFPKPFGPRGELEVTVVLYDEAGEALDAKTLTLPALGGRRDR